jgi:hypothetical protein
LPGAKPEAGLGEGNMTRITVVIEYPHEGSVPLFHAHMKVFIGNIPGEIVAVAFEDVLKEMEKHERD